MKRAENRTSRPYPQKPTEPEKVLRDRTSLLLKVRKTLQEVIQDLPEGIDFSQVRVETEGLLPSATILVYFIERPNPKYDVEYAEYLAKSAIYEKQKALHDKLDELEREARRFK